MSKSCWEYAAQILKINSGIKADHNVHNLWNQLWPMLEKIEKIPDDYRKPIVETLATIEKYNKNGQMFRYPIDKLGKLRSLEQETLINYEILRDEISSSYIALEGVSGYIGHLASIE